MSSSPFDRPLMPIDRPHLLEHMLELPGLVSMREGGAEDATEHKSEEKLQPRGTTSICRLIAILEPTNCRIGMCFGAGLRAFRDLILGGQRRNWGRQRLLAFDQPPRQVICHLMDHGVDPVALGEHDGAAAR